MLVTIDVKSKDQLLLLGAPVQMQFPTAHVRSYVIALVTCFSLSSFCNDWVTINFTKRELPLTADKILEFSSRGNLVIAIHTEGVLVSHNAGKEFFSVQLPWINLGRFGDPQIHIDDSDRIFVSVGSRLFVSDDRGESFSRSDFESVDEHISSIQSRGNNVFVTFGPYHEICEWNKILISQDGGVTFRNSVRFGTQCQSYHRLALTDEGLFVANADVAYLSADNGQSFQEIEKSDPRWVKIEDQRRTYYSDVNERFLQLALPEHSFPRPNTGMSFPVSYMNKNFNSSEPTLGIVYYYFDARGNKIFVDANDAPRKVWLDAQGNFYYLSFNGLYVSHADHADQ